MQEKFAQMEINDVIALAQNGNDEAMTYVLENYKNLALKCSRNYYLIDGDSQDAIQEGMIGLFKAIRDFKCETGVPFYSFAALCIKRQIITAVKRSTRLYNKPLNSYTSLDKPLGEDNKNTLSSTLVAPGLDPETDFIEKERAEFIRTELAQKCTDFEYGVLLDYLDGLSYRDIAERWRRSTKAIDNALTRVKNKMERIVSKDDDNSAQDGLQCKKEVNDGE